MQLTSRETDSMVKSVEIRTKDELLQLMKRSQGKSSVLFGDLMVKEGIISQEQLQEALAQQKQSKGKRLGQVMLDMGLITKEQTDSAMASKLGIPFVDLEHYVIDPDAIAMLDAQIVHRYNVLPLALVGKRLIVALEDPFDWPALEGVAFYTNLIVEPVMATRTQIQRELGRLFTRMNEAEALDSLEMIPVNMERDDAVSEQEAMRKPVIRLVNGIILEAVVQGASDINIRPERDRVDIYYRVNGKLYWQRALDVSILPAVVSRIKITGQMNIAERRAPQDGRARMTHNGRTIDLRISIMPTAKGESVVIRILNKETGVKPLAALGFGQLELDRLHDIVTRSYGIFLVTGPTGSGKSTTLYGVLDQVKKGNPHIITVEDPVEYDIEGVEQIQINPVKGYTFAEALRHILRHDPDVVMVGEIRDGETADIANKAAMTGHLVFSTLHTNDAVSAVRRLIDMGVEPYLLSSTLLGAMAQRLVRVTCPHCKEVELVEPFIRKTMGVAEDEVFYRGKGCKQCNHTGYSGRTTVCELMQVSPEIAHLININANTQEIKKVALDEGMRTLTQNALALAREGVISLEEAFAVRLE